MAHGGKREGAGRKLGEPNKITTELKEMILDALDKAGGVEYLQQQADKSPTAFLSLIGKILPMQVSGEGGGPISVVIRKFTDECRK
jgi:hypothetical protein